MDVRSKLLTPTITDFHALDEYAEALHDATPGIERDVARLKQAPGDEAAIASLFRTLHNIKGDATVCQVELAAILAHPLESVVARLRSGEIAFGGVLAEAILLATDRLELAVEALIARRSLENFRLPALLDGLEKLAAAAPGDVETVAGALIEAVTDFRPAAESSLDRSRTAGEELDEELPGARIGGDLPFFRTLAEQLESRSPLFKGRTTRLLRLASETNQIRGLPIDPTQLEAAIYMHDIGMMFLPESLWLKPGQITPEERARLREHPGYAAGLLSRMKGWDAAAEMIAQHHEMPDGRGYPEGRVSAAICDGAKVLAIVDAFESVMLKHASRGRNRSVLRAIAEINACDNQFAPEWIEPFNQVIHRTINA
ncbi:MAG: HD domain-containing protein [Candidatus Accumulibacter sp.]|nr:HD domain-containing protein [Accumulibacter sp.]